MNATTLIKVLLLFVVLVCAPNATLNSGVFDVVICTVREI